MTVRGGGRPRDPRTQAHPYSPDDYATAAPHDAAWSTDPRRSGGNGRRSRGGGGGLGGLLRFLIFTLILAAIVLSVSLTVLRPLVSDAIAGWAYDNPSALRIDFVRGLVEERLGSALTTPPSADGSDQTFTVREGDTVRTVAARLQEQGFVTDSRAFMFHATLRSLAPQLEAGDFRLTKAMTPDQIVTGLMENEIVITVVAKTFREGLRIEQMAAFMQTWTEDLGVDPEEFSELAMEPTTELLDDYPWLQASGLPDGAPLEGYLFPAQYDLLPDTTAEDLIRMMLDRFLREVGEDRAREATFFERLTLASIVEREAKLSEERPLVAGAYQNRLDGSGPQQILNADPTVFYGLDTVALGELEFDEWDTYTFWVPPGVPLAEAPLPEELERYNTYRNRGLPPGPICSPGLSSIEAALAPDTEEGYMYFVAIPGENGKHDFSKTFEEHQEKLRQYGYL